MLDEKDIQTVQAMIDKSESRMIDRMDGMADDLQKRMDARKESLEQRMDRIADDLRKRMDAQKEFLEKRMDAQVEEIQNRMIAYFELAIIPKFELLAEGHKTLQETMAPKSRVDDLEDEVAFLKQAVKSMSRDIAELKKAQ